MGTRTQTAFSSIVETLVKNFPTPSIHQPHKPFTPKDPTILSTNLIKSYFQQGQASQARNLFDEMPLKDVVSWTAMISGYASGNEHRQAWRTFVEMFKGGGRPNPYTLSSLLKACKGMGDVGYGRLLHGLAVKLGLEGFIYVDNGLVDMYANCCNSMKNSYAVFRGIEVKNAVTWTTLIAGYTHRGHGQRALQFFREMLLEIEESNPYTFSIAIRACASVGSKDYGEQMHTAVIKHGFESNLPVMNSILDMYCRCDFLSEANRSFNEMTQKDLISWNTLIAGYERLDSSEALVIFTQMEREGFCPNCFTLTTVVAACANLAALHCGQQVHGGIIRRGLDTNSVLANALIDMYAKCGNITESSKVFSEMSCRDLLSWTSMMIGYGAHGYGKEAVDLFDEMVQSGIKPDQVVFMGVLSACSHAGLVDQGLKYFNSMMDYYKVKPNQEIYGCAVDLLGRAGRVEEAFQLIQSMPFKPDESVWGALLSAWKAHGLPHLDGKLATWGLLDLKPNKVGTCVMLSHIYAAEGKWGEFAQMRKLIRAKWRKKEAGRSWIEVRDQVYSFVVGDKVGSHIEWVYDVLDLLIHHMKDARYLPDIDCLIDDLQDGTKLQE